MTGEIDVEVWLFSNGRIKRFRVTEGKKMRDRHDKCARVWVKKKSRCYLRKLWCFKIRFIREASVEILCEDSARARHVTRRVKSKQKIDCSFHEINLAVSLALTWKTGNLKRSSCQLLLDVYFIIYHLTLCNLKSSQSCLALKLSLLQHLSIYSCVMKVYTFFIIIRI